MNSRRSCIAWALAIASVITASCGGNEASDGIDGTGTQAAIVSYGRLSGFGSVEINGVHFDTAGATFVIDGAVGSQADLDLGDIVLVEGTIEAGASRGVAQKVIADHVLLGRIESLDVGGKAFVALGQTVRIDDQTLFAAEFAARVSALQVGDAISVSGFRNIRGDVIATRIERQAAGSPVFRTTGALTDLVAASKRLVIGGLVVDYAGATMLPNDAANTLARGIFVEVKGAWPGGGAPFAATSVEIKRQRLPGDADASAKLEGYVTALDPQDPSRFQVDGLAVALTSATVHEGTLTVDAPVAIAGSVNSAGAVVATAIRTNFFAQGGGYVLEGRVFDAQSGPVADAMIDIWVQTADGFGYSSTWAAGGRPLRTAPDGRFATQVPRDSLLTLYAHKAGFVQPCAVIRNAAGNISFDVELVAIATLDATNPPPPLSAAGAITVTGITYETTVTGQQPVPGTELWFGDSMGITVATTVSDRDGRYLACNLPHDGRWPWGTELWASKPGYAGTTIPVIDTSRSTVVDIEMKRQ